ncbi:hypothetical protein BC830DRAFT_842626 [Chytriomyces sp. MP71]|nr:hypothetical protein BC830DRAFT_842626 [Chytriomyces sp. MP71]
MRRKSESIDVADTRTRSLPRSQPQAPPREHTLAEWEGSVSDPGNASVDIALRISSGTASSSAFSSKLGDDTSSYRKDSKGSQSVPIVPPKTDPDAIVAHHGEGTEVERISSDTVVPAGQRPYEPLPPSSPGWLSSNHTGFELDLVNAAVPLAGTGFVSPETTPPGLGRGKGVGSGASLVLPAKKGS